ncbi:hypothetical protein P3X46_019675 [Hevea brasiliensis]|uniref:Disease resistance protein RGA3 n=1 Tax=Hevea brasiliensis TaxID=3981 RepID=A0ABQ9LN98_HEVBR|nr:hypothetical protein P3X46_019675 [Hevea brasiliensis]
MADALVSKVLEELISIIASEIEQEVSLVVGVKKEVQMLTTQFQLMKAVLVDAENKQLKNDAVKLWMQKLKNISYDMDDVLDEWTTAIQKSQIMGDERVSAKNKWKVRCLICFSCFRFREVGVRHDIAVKIKDLSERLDIIFDEQRVFNFVSFQKETKQEVERPISASFIDMTKVQGRDQEKNAIVEKLLTESSQTPSPHIISIVGMGGIGKTTLAKLVYNEDKLKTHFETRIWVCVSDPFDEIKIAKAILESLTNGAPNLHELQTILQNIQQFLGGKRFLLILDDVWEENSAKWEQLKDCLSCGSPGSRILVTTRKEIVASAMGCIDIYEIGQLSVEDSWSLFSQIAFFGWSDGERKQLEDIGRKIASKCKGLPLAVKTLGSLLQSKKSKKEWQSIMDNEVWKLEKAEVDLFPHLLLSYNDLSPPLRQCFSYCAIFPKDHLIDKQKLIESWMAHGYLKETPRMDMETLGEEYFKHLASRSFFQDINRVDNNIPLEAILFGISCTCKMHDIVHDFAQYITRDECFSMEVRSSVEQSTEYIRKEARYSRIVLAEEGSLPDYFYDVKKLRGLVIQSKGGSVIKAVLPSLFSELTCLRSLDLSCCDIEEIPPTIRQLIHLRQLDLSTNSELKLLPEALCELYNLQTLDIGDCNNLEKVPDGIGKLVNLRHLHNSYTIDALLPREIKKLSCLRTLEWVNAGDDREEAFSLDDLESLNLLQGLLALMFLGKVSNVDEGKKAHLKKKKGIDTMHLYFHGEEGNWRINHDEELLEVLEPHPNLEVLNIVRYEGTVFPGWIMSLINLRHLKLVTFTNCEKLPPLGKLPFLEELDLVGNYRLKKLGIEFLGIETSNQHEISSSAVAFPKLTRLLLRKLEEWEEWDDGMNTDGEEDIANVTILPCLRSFNIFECPKLKLETLPYYLVRKLPGFEDCSTKEETMARARAQWQKVISSLHLVSYVSSFLSSYFIGLSQ